MAQSFIKVTGVQGTVRNLNRVIEWANIKTPNVTFDAAERGKKYARDIAPKDTRALINAIEVASNRGKGFVILSRTPKHKDGRYRKYHMMMHGLYGKDTSNSIRSGDPRYMFTMFEWLRKKYPMMVQESLDRALRK